MKTFITSFSLLITFFSINFDFKAITITAIATNVSWTTASSWDLGRVPECGDTIIVPAGSTIRITEDVNLNTGDPLCSAVKIEISGRLSFSAGAKIRLAPGACFVVHPGGVISPSAKGGGASENITIDNVRIWQASDGPLFGPASFGCGVVLPLTLVNFDAYLIANELTANWTTASESNLNTFTVEISLDGLNWIPVRTIRADNSTTSAQYGFTNNIEITIDEESYIKLSSIDFDGKTVTLSTKVLNQNIAKEKNTLNIFPNPANRNENITLAINSDFNFTKIEIFNQYGTLVYSNSIELNKNNKIQLMNQIPQEAGNYFVSLSNESEILKNKFVIL